MKILSIDVGMKNLAYCLLDLNEKKIEITNWDIIDLCENTKNTCEGYLKNGKKCTSKPNP